MISSKTWYLKSGGPTGKWALDGCHPVEPVAPFSAEQAHA